VLVNIKNNKKEAQMEKWIGECVAKMHIHGIKQDELASEIGIRRDYLNKILNGKEKPSGARIRITEALNAIVSRRNANGL
jgi:plasmid maintenance system antidote protein VapI